jgi:hypothetical protein
LKPSNEEIQGGLKLYKKICQFVLIEGAVMNIKDELPLTLYLIGVNSGFRHSPINHEKQKTKWFRRRKSPFIIQHFLV